MPLWLQAAQAALQAVQQAREARAHTAVLLDADRQALAGERPPGRDGPAAILLIAGHNDFASRTDPSISRRQVASSRPLGDRATARRIACPASSPADIHRPADTGHKPAGSQLLIQVIAPFGCNGNVMRA